MTETAIEKTGTRKHAWERAEREKWKPFRSANMEKKYPGWLDIFFWCDLCECRGHAMWKEGDGEPPEHPEEAQNMNTQELVDAYGDCNVQVVESVHAR